MDSVQFVDPDLLGMMTTPSLPPVTLTETPPGKTTDGSSWVGMTVAPLPSGTKIVFPGSSVLDSLPATTSVPEASMIVPVEGEGLPVMVTGMELAQVARRSTEANTWICMIVYRCGG